ncbi:MAG: glucose-6-phosphate isomerase, partial [Chloroflexi bacterium]|nr:glucose-6-phosphate isomerase [Chloroflexota bacterium]
MGEPTFVEGDLRVYGPLTEARTVGEYIKAFLQKVPPNGYIALMAYLDRRAETFVLLQRLRGLLGRATGLATTVGYGPRFLHSTGQL